MHVPVDRQTCHVIPDTNRTTRRIRLGVIIIALFVLLSTQANAASFDCKKASTWLEKTVCSNPELSKLDEEMAKAYSDALASLSPEGQKETKQYQKQWLKEISPYCEARMKSAWHDDAAECLKYTYEERIQQLQQSLIKFPDYIFRNVYVSHSKADKTCEYLYDKKDLTYPQIEKPRDENEKFWNNFISQKVRNELKIDDKCTDADVNYTVRFCNKYLIAIDKGRYYYPQGAPHGSSNSESFNWLLEDKSELKASDLFDDKTDWRNKLAALVTQKLKKQAVADKKIYTFAEWLDVKKSVTSLHRWLLSKDGLSISFDEYECDLDLITIDWKTLVPYMSKKGRSLIYD